MSWRQYAHNWRCIVKRFWIVLVAVAMAMVSAIPAGAAKPAKPAPTLYEVAFDFSGASDGFSTRQCGIGESLTMEAGPGGRLGATGDLNEAGDEGTDVPLFDVRLPGLEWHRYYPYYPDAESALDDDFDPNSQYSPTAGIGLTGCHGGGIDVFVDTDGFSVKDYPRFLMLTVRDGSVDFRWEADYYLENLETASKNPRKPTVSLTAMEGFSYSGSLEWAGVWDKTAKSSGLVTGEINVSHFSPGVYEPFTGSPVYVEFTMTICPHGSGEECLSTSE